MRPFYADWISAPDGEGGHSVVVHRPSGEIIRTYPHQLDPWAWTQSAAEADAAGRNLDVSMRERSAEREAQHADRDRTLAYVRGLDSCST